MGFFMVGTPKNQLLPQQEQLLGVETGEFPGIEQDCEPWLPTNQLD